MITLHPKPGIELLAVEVPEDAYDFRVLNSLSIFKYFYSRKSKQYYKGELLGIPPGQYSFIATSREITEEQEREIINEKFLGHPNGSLKALIYSAGGDPNKFNYAFLMRKIKTS